KPDKKPLSTGILCKVYKTGVTVFEDIIDQFLYDPENNELVFGLKPFPVVMKAGAGIHASRSADPLEKIIYRRFKSKIFQRGRHQTMGDVADQLDGIVDDLLCIVDTLELGLFIQVHEVLVEIEPRGSQEWSCIIVQISCYTLPFFLLQADGCV